MGAYPPFELAKSISRRKAGAQPGGLETSGGVGTTLSIPCRPASLVLLNFKMAGGLKVGSPTIGGQKLQTYKMQPLGAGRPGPYVASGASMVAREPVV